MVRMNENQHYVTRAYLENFAFKKGRSDQIRVYDLKQDKKLPSNIKQKASRLTCRVAVKK